MTCCAFDLNSLITTGAGRPAKRCASPGFRSDAASRAPGSQAEPTSTIAGRDEVIPDLVPQRAQRDLRQILQRPAVAATPTMTAVAIPRPRRYGQHAQYHRPEGEEHGPCGEATPCSWWQR